MLIKVPKHSNVAVFQKTDFPSDLTPLIESKFVGLLKSLKLFWGTKDFHEYLSSVAMKPSDNLKSEGFPFEVIRELYRLHVAHDAIFPVFKKTDKWDILP